MNLIRHNQPSSLIFNNFFKDFFNEAPETGYYPSVDITETDSSYVLNADLPGYTQEDFNVSVKEDVLTLSSVKKQEETEQRYLLRERRVHSFKRSFILPKNADKENIKAAFKNGVLTLTMAKVPEAQPRNIEIHIE